jgi:hypothetical protein
MLSRDKNNYVSSLESNKEYDKVFVYNDMVVVEKDIIGYFLGKGKKNFEYLKSLSTNVILELRKKNNNLLITIKSNNKQDYNLVNKQLDKYLQLSYEKLKQLKEMKRNVKKLEEKKRENKIRKELEEKILRQLEEQNSSNPSNPSNPSNTNNHNVNDADDADNVDNIDNEDDVNELNNVDVNIVDNYDNIIKTKTKPKNEKEDNYYRKPKNIFTLLEVE